MKSNPIKNKSLSAESELASAYDLLYNGKYKQCLNIIKKKMPKLKSPIDKAYFNILKLRVLRKLKQTKEEKELLEQLVKEFMTKEELYLDENVSNYFKNILRNIDETKSAQDIFEVQLKHKDLNTINEKQQKGIFKELTLGLQFKDIYSKCNLFLKQPNLSHEKFLILLKHEAVYYLFKSKKLPESMTKKILDDFIKNLDKLRDETGYFDIVAQFAQIFKNDKLFSDIMGQIKKDEVTHVPIEEIKLEKLYELKNYDEVIKIIFEKIKENPEKCLFNDYERLINLIFWFSESNNVKIDATNVITDIKSDNSSELVPLDNTNVEKLIKIILNLFEYIKTTTGTKIINSFKSSIIGSLMICHNLIRLNKSFENNIQGFVKSLITQLLEKAVNKQSILFELGKYFTLLNENDRNELINKFKPEESDDNNFTKLTENNFNSFLFYMKLRKMFGMDKDKPVNDLIFYLIKVYLFMTKNITKKTKLEKGERNIADDLIILANEYYYEKFTTNEVVETSLASILMSINIFARNKSPYNYDISYYLAKTYAYLVMNQDSLDTLIYMNLKGPQAESVSYFLFNYFINFNPGMNYLITHSENWQVENRTNSKKTLWKMFQSGNYWKSQELLDFLEENNLSYYNYLLEFYDIVMGLSDCLLEGKESDEEKDKKEKNFFEVIEKFYNKILPLMGKLIKNQDIFITLHKYDPNSSTFFDNKYELLNNNKNYSLEKYRYILDSLNKEKNCLYEYYPGYKNNYFEHPTVSPFRAYDNKKYLLMKILSILIISKVIKSEKDLEPQLIDLNKKYKELSEGNKSQLDSILSSLIDIFINSFKDIKYLVENKEKMFDLYSTFGKEVIDHLNLLRKDIKYKEYKTIIEMNETFHKNKYFYFFLFTNITSKIQDLISEHKKESNDIANLKAKLNEIYKAPLINCLREIQNKVDELLKIKDSESELWNYENDYKTNFGEAEHEDEVLSEFKALAIKIRVRHTELFEEIKDSSKKIVDYIKQLI